MAEKLALKNKIKKTFTHKNESAVLKTFLKTSFSKVSKYQPHTQSSAQQNEALSSSLTADQWKGHGKIKAQKTAEKSCGGFTCPGCASAYVSVNVLTKKYCNW